MRRCLFGEMPTTQTPMKPGVANLVAPILQTSNELVPRRHKIGGSRGPPLSVHVSKYRHYSNAAPQPSSDPDLQAASHCD